LLTPEHQRLIEKLTRKQANCKQWHKVREGRVTASKGFEVRKTQLENPFKSLLQQFVYPTVCTFQFEATKYDIYIMLLNIVF